MSTIKAYAVICTADLEKAKAWYGQLFGRKPDSATSRKRGPGSQIAAWRSLRWGLRNRRTDLKISTATS
jgi:hypothetical protein